MNTAELRRLIAQQITEGRYLQRPDDATASRILDALALAGALKKGGAGMSDKMLEALKLADAALSGANMNMTVVMRKIREALAEQLVNGEAVVEADVQRVIDRLMSSDPDFEDCEEAANMLRQLATATPAPAFDVVIAGDELAALHEWTAPDNEAGVRLFVAQGGLHMVCADYPDEGSVHLADVAAPPAPAVPEVPRG